MTDYVAEVITLRPSPHLAEVIDIVRSAYPLAVIVVDGPEDAA